MKKYVYLFELDSVRKTDEEICIGQKALYNEIVHNGNTVVLTYNQLIDSRAFFGLLKDEEYYKNFVALVENGAIKLSQFGTVRTLVQYLLYTIDAEDNEYIYSALPIKSCQRRLVELIKRSLMHSDLSEIYEYISPSHRTVDELRDLFVEVEKTEILGRKTIREQETVLSVEEMEKILENLYGLLGMVLRLSTMHEAFVTPRDTLEYKNYGLNHYLAYVMEMQRPKELDPLWNDAVAILSHLSCKDTNVRSLYFREIKTLFSSQPEYDKATYQYAEAIVNVCKNYAYEMSICGISKHYNVTDIQEKPVANSSFFVDFLLRLKEHWNDGVDADKRFLQDETNTYEPYNWSKEIPDFSKAVHIVRALETEKFSSDTVFRYEYNIKEQRRQHKLAFVKKVPRQLGALLFAFMFWILFNMALEIVSNIFSGEYTVLSSWETFFHFGVEMLAFLIVGEFITSLVSRKYTSLLSLSEAIAEFISVLRDLGHLLFKKNVTHISQYKGGMKEEKHKVSPIDFYETKELKKYIAFFREKPELVTEAVEYPISDVEDKLELKSILRSQELQKRKYGIVYDSQYNLLVVDPIKANPSEIYPYERIVPSAKQHGVVLFITCKDKIVLLRQFKHAIRQEQLCCLRGYGEDGMDSVDNVKKELCEELATKVVDEPIKLGVITADSGLTSGNAEVYLIRIDTYENTKSEGIREVVEMSEIEFQECLQRGEINDGYTLAAYSLYLTYSRYNNQ